MPEMKPSARGMRKPGADRTNYGTAYRREVNKEQRTTVLFV